VFEADPVKLKQVFVNLVGNAVKFTPAGGRVTVSGETSEAWLQIRIGDTGIGMRSEDIPLVIQPFYRASSVMMPSIRAPGLDCRLRRRGRASRRHPRHREPCRIGHDGHGHLPADPRCGRRSGVTALRDNAAMRFG